MQLARLGASHATRLSFMRILLRRLARENWRYERRLFQIDGTGVGRAILCLHGPERSYSLVAFAHDLPDDQRSDRVIATAWDATFTLFDGVPSDADLDRLAANVPLQEAGRVSERELTVSRANRSMRMFDSIVACLAEGGQPTIPQIDAVGYLMRTTAVYGSGKLGAADRESLAQRVEFSAPFQAEMMTVWLIRAFTLDLVDHLAKARSASAQTLDPGLRRRFGVGNSTGLGMAPFVINHPVLFNNWIAARETALARVRALGPASAALRQSFTDLVARAVRHVADWQCAHPLQAPRIAQLAADLAQLTTLLDEGPLTGPAPWDALWQWGAENLSLEGQEKLAALIVEPHGDLVDDLADTLCDDDSAHLRLDGAMSVAAMREVLRDIYDWALDLDWNADDSQARLWYVSAEKQEPRLAERADEPLDPFEQPLAPARDATRLFHVLEGFDDDTPLARVLLDHPDLRKAALRAQIAARYPYAEIHGNTIGAQMLPIDLLRAKLSFFGAGHFDPRSDRWVRINMFRGAPGPEDLPALSDDWMLPEMPATPA